MPQPSGTPRLVTLGRLALLDAGGHDVVSPESGKLLALLTYITCSPGRRATRQRLLDLFWGDSPEAKGRNALRQALHKLREVVGERLVSSPGGDEVIIGTDLAIDRDAFVAAIDAGDLQTAVNRYTGPFAPGFFSAGSADFEHWADQERQHLHDLFAAAADTLARARLRAGDAGCAQGLAARLLEFDGLDEGAWRLRIEAEAAAGSRVHLAASVAELQRRFGEENRQLKPQTHQLINAVTRPLTAPGPEPEPTLVADLVGRQAEFGRLHDGWRRAVSRRMTQIHVSGRAGLGKTRLLEDFTIRLRGERARIIAVRATPRQRTLPNAMLAKVVSALAELSDASGVAEPCARILVDLEPTVASRFPNAAPYELTDPVERRRSRVSAVHDLLMAVTDAGPLCLVLDDIHWWDAESRDAIADVVDPIKDRPLLLVTASRPGSPVIAGASEEIVLTPLTADEIAALVTSLGEASDGQSVAALSRALRSATDGVPLFVLEALRLGLDRGTLGLHDTSWDFASLPDFLASLRPGGMLADRIASLSAPQRHALLLAAVIEQPLDEGTAAALGIDSPSAVLSELERHGMLSARSGGWVVAHDAIAQTAIDSATDDARRQAERAVGVLLLSHSTSQRTLVEALRHLIDGGDELAVTEACATWIRNRRAGGDHRSGAAIVRDLLGPIADAGFVEETVSSIPSRLRHRPRTFQPAWGVAATAVAGLAMVLVMSKRPSDAPDAVLGVFAQTDSTVTQIAVPLRIDGWERSRAELPTVSRRKGNMWYPGRENLYGRPVRSPDGSQWLIARPDTGQLGPTELMLVDSAGVERPIAPAHGDDVAPSWAPDGRAVVFQSTRWSPPDDATFNLGIIDMRTRQVRRLTSGSASDELPRWSPDGTRIAFLRTPSVLAPTEVCWITPDGLRERCRTFATNVEHVLGWLDSRTLAVTLGAGDAGQLASVNLIDGRSDVLATGRVGDASLSPDGRWVACICGNASERMGDPPIAVFPIRDAGNRRNVGGPSKSAQLFWYAASPRPWLRNIRIVAPSGPITIGARYRLRVIGSGSDGAALTIPEDVLSWRSSDTSVASVDSAGYVNPRSPGSTWMTASAGGWRSDSIRIAVGVHAPVAIHDEKWDTTWPGRWTIFGTAPLPAAVQDTALGRAFTPNGNGTYDNGVVSRKRFAAKDGLGIEAVIESPVTRSKWQRIGMSFMRVDSLTPGGPGGIGACAMQNPSDEGWAYVHSIRLSSGDASVPAVLASGKPFRVRLQLFPDGTCGLAINGQVIERSTPRFRTDLSYSIVLKGESVRTRMLVGPLTIWTGVRGGVDWDEPAPDSVRAGRVPHLQ
ncbi:MAG: AAA family ATPase [Gemmatimonadales bacterium]